MKKSIIALMLLISIGVSNSFCQKIRDNNYKNVERVNTYTNAQTITYKDKLGKLKTDTIYFNKQKQDVNIVSCKEVNIFDKKLKQKK